MTRHLHMTVLFKEREGRGWVFRDEPCTVQGVQEGLNRVNSRPEQKKKASLEGTLRTHFWGTLNCV